MRWSDELDGPAGAPPSPASWSAETGFAGDGQLQRYTASNALLDGRGRVAITARREADGTVSSARLVTKGKVEITGGRVAARIKVPRGVGVWPAFWLLGADIDAVGWPACGELDVMEHVGSQPRHVHGTIHGPGRPCYLLLNLAIGGRWPGNETTDPTLPATMLVDWVRVE